MIDPEDPYWIRYVSGGGNLGFIEEREKVARHGQAV